MKPATATINQQALRHNIELIKSFAPQQKLLAMIKANAYGQGLLPAAHALCDLVDRNSRNWLPRQNFIG